MKILLKYCFLTIAIMVKDGHVKLFNDFFKGNLKTSNCS